MKKLLIIVLHVLMFYSCSTVETFGPGDNAAVSFIVFSDVQQG
jgi:hypothetical protein